MNPTTDCSAVPLVERILITQVSSWSILDDHNGLHQDIASYRNKLLWDLQENPEAHTLRALQPRQLDASPEIHVAAAILLSPAARTIITNMFTNYDRVVVGGEFTSGYSGSRVFWVQPIKGNVPELLSVVKVGLAWRIYQEWRAFEAAVRGHWPHTVVIEGRPVTSPDNQWAGLRYPLVGGGGAADVQSLHDACTVASTDEAEALLAQRLFPILKKTWQFCYPYPALPLRASYDQVLPINLVVEPMAVPAHAPVISVHPAMLPIAELAPGDYVHIDGFVVSEIDSPGQIVTLNLPQRPDKPAVSHWLRLQPVPSTEMVQVGQQIDGVTGRVVATRSRLLRDNIQRVWPDCSDLAAGTIALEDGTILPNPLAKLNEILDRSHHVKMGHIHGDLHFANVLVEQQTGAVHLIDFANARVDHVLHDLLCLEIWLVTQMLPGVLAEARLPAATILPLYRHLHQATMASSGDFDIRRGLPWATRLSLRLNYRQQMSALQKTGRLLFGIRQMARRYLFDPSDWSEYLDGLSLYLLGALKRKGLDRSAHGAFAKRIAFLAAATTIYLREYR